MIEHGSMPSTDESSDRVVEAYKHDIDRTLLRYNLTLTVEQRFEQLARLQAFAEALRAAARRAVDRD
jgi:hypothetical protein